MDEDILIIENTKEGRDDYGHMYGSSHVEITLEHLQALKDGKCLAFNDCEYSTFVSLKKDDEKSS